MGSSDDWEAVFEARVAALPANEEKYSWYAKLPEIVAMSGSAGAGEAGVDPDLYENVKRALTGGEGSAAIASAAVEQISAAIASKRATPSGTAFSRASMAYAGIEAIVTHPLLNGHAQCVVDFDDRWQAPLSGGYSDCQLLICIMGHLCELQVNVREMIVAKKGGGHVAYDVWRFVNEYLLFASIQNDVVGMRKLLASGLVTSAPDAIKDQNGFRSCHF
ncbi:hypothetical protein JL720_1347 [Aureococcus anophagefferens]|nr:hypothetical protein JL720_1347 [Aureococcus anophagefferens]